MIPSVTRCHVAVQLPEASTIIGHNCCPLAVCEEWIRLHALHQLIVLHNGFIVVVVRKNRSSINNADCVGVVDVDDDGGETLLTNKLIANLICAPLRAAC